MYFIALAFLLVISYFLITYFLQYFFYGKIIKTSFSGFHIACILILFSLFIFVSLHFFQGEISNRIQHALGGGSIMSIVFYFSYKASQVKITKFQYFVMSFLLASLFGIANELAESILQLNFGSIFASNITDTWMDLWANTLGALFPSIIFAQLMSKTKN